MVTAANADERLVLQFFATLSNIEIADGKIKALREYMDSYYIVQLFA